MKTRPQIALICAAATVVASTVWAQSRDDEYDREMLMQQVEVLRREVTRVATRVDDVTADVMRLDKGRLGVGMVADVTVLDLEREITVDPSSFVSKARNTPFSGWKLRGAPRMTIVGGQIVFDAMAN